MVYVYTWKSGRSPKGYLNTIMLKQRAVIWGSVATVACILLLVSVCVWNCCTLYICKRSKRDNTRLKVTKFLCGALLLLPALLSV